MQLFYSHGFHSGKDSITYQRIRDGLGVVPLQLVYDNGGDFRHNLYTLKTQLNNYIATTSTATFGFIANSLGAFYLWQLILHIASRQKCEEKHLMPRTLVLFNPVFEPLWQLKKYIDKPEYNTSTRETFTLTRNHWESYAYALRTSMPKHIRTIVCLSKNDELIDIDMTRAYWRLYAEIMQIQGGHIITDFAPLSACLSSYLQDSD